MLVVVQAVVGRGQDVGQHFQDGDLVGVGRNVTGRFRAAQAAADDDHVLARAGLVGQVVGDQGRIFNAGNGRHCRGAARGQDDLVVAAALDVVGSGGLVQLDVHPQFPALAFLVGDELEDVGLEIRTAGCPQGSAETAFLFPEVHVEAALTGGDGGFHAAGAAADDQDPALQVGLGRWQGVFLFGVAGGVDGAVIVLAGKAGEEAFVAADAGTDVSIVALFHLGGPIGVSQHFMGHPQVVQSSVGNHLFGQVGVEQLAVAQYGQGGHFLDGLLGVQLVAFFGVDGGDGGVPFLVAARIHVEGVHTGVFQDFGHGQAFVQIPEALDPLDRREFDDHRHVRGDVLLDFGDAFQGEAHAVFQGAAVFIGAGVPLFGLELVQQVSAVGVELDGVGTGQEGELGAVAHLAHQVMDVFHGKGLALEVGEPEGAAVAGAVWRGEGVGELLAAQAGGQLHADLGAVVMAAVDEHVQPFHVVEIRKLGTGTGFVFGGNHVGTGDDQARTAFGPFHEIIDAIDIVGSVRFAGGAHGRHEDPVFQTHGSNGRLVKQCVAHVQSPLFIN